MVTKIEELKAKQMILEAVEEKKKWWQGQLDWYSARRQQDLDNGEESRWEEEIADALAKIEAIEAVAAETFKKW